MMEEVNTDVLVIGSGGAGLRAAIAARQEGCSVNVISKSSATRGTATLISNGVFGSSGFGMSADEYATLTLDTGCRLNNPSLVKVLAEEIPLRIKELSERGARFKEATSGVVVLRKPPDSGREVTDVLLSWARSSGVQIIDWVTAAEFIAMEGRVAACTAVRRDGSRLFFRTGAVVLATGGASALFRVHDNPVFHVGDGYALAGRAGAELQDMEFSQFYPLIASEPHAPRLLIQPFLAEAGELVNDQGENLLEKYSLTDARPVALRARDRLSRALFRECLAGRTVYLDLRGLQDKDWEDPFAHNVQRTFERRLKCKEKPVRIMPTAHYTMGGVVVDSEGRTAVEGLFAAGEVACGLHGANRLGGNGLSETLVFGLRAGAAAGRYCREQGKPPRSSRREDTLFPDSAPYLSGKLLPSEVLNRIREILWNWCGPVRNKEGLTRAVTELGGLEDQGILCRKANDMAAAIAIWNGLYTAKLIARGALDRPVSVGAHFRED